MGKLIAPLLAVAIAMTGCTSPPVPTSPAQRTDNVAVIVVDDFKAQRGEQGDLPADHNCTYSPESANDVISHGAGDGLPPGISHGEAVYARLAKELSDTTGLATVPTAPDEDGRWTYYGKQVVLTKLDTGTFDTIELAKQIRDKVDAMSAGPTKFRRFVLNMSFVIAPCNVPKWLSDHGLLDINHVIALYRGLVEGVPEMKEFRDALEALARSANPAAQLIAPDDGLGPVRRLLAVSLFYALVEQQNDAALVTIHSDPLKARIGMLMGAGNKVISVGAAGNGIWVAGPRSGPLVRRQLPFPFAPALWNPVVSASASDEDLRARAYYSNSGEVKLDGRTSISGANLHGTSFAAPRLSAQEAVWLLTGGEIACTSSFPALGYTDSDQPGQTWLDLSVTDAAVLHCPGFPNLLTTP